MRFEWDEAKNRENLRKHKLDFADASDMWNAPLLVIPDVRELYGEERWIGIGQIRGRVVVLAFAQRSDDLIRIISLRKANMYERTEYEKAIKDELA